MLNWFKRTPPEPVKLCCDCKHFNPEYEACVRPSADEFEFTLVYGKQALPPRIRMALFERIDGDGECGRKALFWEPKAC